MKIVLLKKMLASWIVCEICHCKSENEFQTLATYLNLNDFWQTIAVSSIAVPIKVVRAGL